MSTSFMWQVEINYKKKKNTNDDKGHVSLYI